MGEMLLTRTLGGMLAPQTDEDAAQISRFKVGATIRCKTSAMRNAKFHKKWFALAKSAFDMWSDELPELEHAGVMVRPEFERFRKDLTIMAGYYRPVFGVNGTLRLEAESLGWAEMDEDRFESLYSATIDAILSKVLKQRITEAQLRDNVDQIMRFA